MDTDIYKMIFSLVHYLWFVIDVGQISTAWTYFAYLLTASDTP